VASLQIYDPFADTAVETLFRNFFHPERGDRATPQGIRLDVAENDKGYVVQAELPGVPKDEIHVAVEGNQVTIAAEVKRALEPSDGARVLRTERYYGNVYRSFTLPLELDETASQARYENGVLELRLVKKPAVAGRKLTIQ
jgi:HSP20 family protein